jgi:hypothetical protein
VIVAVCAFVFVLAWLAAFTAPPARPAQRSVIIKPEISETPVTESYLSLTLDPHWNWADVSGLGEPGPVWVKTSCRHLDVADVTIATGQVVARLCLTCDQQLPPLTDWTP